MKYQQQKKEHAEAVKRYIRIQIYASEHYEDSQQEIAAHFKVSRQIVAKALKHEWGKE